MTPQAVNGDTITLPSGNVYMDIICDNYQGDHSSGDQGLAVTIVNLANSGTGKIINFALVPGKASRMTGIEFRDGGMTEEAILVDRNRKRPENRLQLQAGSLQDSANQGADVF